MEYGCGQCMPCRINKQREWIGRLQLELLTAPFSCFVTLTYDDLHLPAGGVLDKRHVQLWMKRLRKELAKVGRTCRYFLVGEYGEVGLRPHYHLILYGVAGVENPLLAKLWTKGFVHVGTVEPGALSYVCGYVLKKMTKKGHPLLMGKPPEFTLMSRNPGIGVASVENLVAAYRTERGRVALKRDGYVSRTVRIGPKTYPLGRYLVGRLARNLDLTDEDRKRANYQACLRKFQEKSKTTTTKYERARKAHVQQQEGRLNFLRAPWKRKL